MDGDWASAPVLDLGAAMPPVDGLAIGRYDEQRAIYTAPEFQTPDGRWRTRHMAVDIFAPAGTPVYAPLDGVVELRENRDRPATTAGCWCCATATSGRCTGTSIRRRWRPARCGRARRSRGSARRRSTAAGSRTCTCSSSPTCVATCPAWR